MEENQELPEKKAPASVPSEISITEADVSSRYDDVYELFSPDHCDTVRWMEGAYEFVCKNGICLRVHISAPGIVRLRYTPNGQFERDFSYALRPNLENEKVTVKLTETDNEYLLVSGDIQVVVTKAGLRVRFYNADDRLLCEDAGGYSARRTVLKGWSEMKVEKKYQRKEVFYGLGDKTCSANLQGKKFENWCTDSFAFGRETDPLYRAVPFYYALTQGLAYGIFLDNTFRTHFDFNSAGDNTVSFWSEGGEMNYYFIYGPDLTTVARGYARLTGSHALPPMWALGYHQCRWSYYPHTRVTEIADTFRKLQIPCDAIYLDIDYMDGFRCFTWNYDHFPDPKGLIDELRDKGFQTVVMIDPGLKADPNYAVYSEALHKTTCSKNTDGQVAYAPVWPGFCGFSDFTDPEVRKWWGRSVPCIVPQRRCIRVLERHE
ncbi:MAG: glycoside hydrolase family 31 protein [Lewinellaceae bacterium]|nr:glycoside hydrolase family 31 protein [Lewinellaceae bacterium]